MTKFGERARRGQTLVETAVVLPFFLLVVFGIIVFGIGIFYQQQVSNAAREAARYAAVHSASSDCPVGGWLAPDPATIPRGANICGSPDTPAAGWPNMTAHAREFIFGMDPTALGVTACWAGYLDVVTGGKDAGPYYAGDPTGATPNTWADCNMGASNVNPLTDTSSLACPSSTSLAAGNDTASNLASSNRGLPLATNRVVVYACYNWSPPVAGFLGIPQTIILRAVVSEGLQHQR